jgi:hypothetical protein
MKEEKQESEARRKEICESGSPPFHSGFWLLLSFIPHPSALIPAFCAMRTSRLSSKESPVLLPASV